MKGKKARKLVGHEVMLFRACDSGFPPIRVSVLKVVGTNVIYKHGEAYDWEYLPLVEMTSIPEGQADG